MSSAAWASTRTIPIRALETEISSVEEVEEVEAATALAAAIVVVIVVALVAVALLLLVIGMLLAPPSGSRWNWSTSRWKRWCACTCLSDFSRSMTSSLSSSPPVQPDALAGRADVEIDPFARHFLHLGVVVRAKKKGQAALPGTMCLQHAGHRPGHKFHSCQGDDNCVSPEPPAGLEPS